MKTQHLNQEKYGENIFRLRLPAIKLKPGVQTIALDDVFYVSVGMVLNAHEKHHKGAFELDDLISETHDAQHPAPYVGGRDIVDFGISAIHYLEYGPALRAPAMIRRQTFPELYDRNKLMVGRFGGFVLDDGTWSPQGYLKCNHTVMILMPWNALHGIENKSIEMQLAKRTRLSLEEGSARIDLRYALGLLNSDQARLFLEGVTRSAITGEAQPDDLREIPIPIPSHETASAVAEATNTAIQAQRELLPFRQEGWSIEFGSIKPSGALPKDISKKPLAVARAAWQLVIHKPSAKTGDLIRVGGDVFRAKQKVMSTSESHGKALDWLVHQLNTLPQGTTLEGAEHGGILVPATPSDGILAFEKLMHRVNEAKGLLGIVSEAKAHISERLGDLFETVSHPPMH